MTTMRYVLTLVFVAFLSGCWCELHDPRPDAAAPADLAPAEDWPALPQPRNPCVPAPGCPRDEGRECAPPCQWSACDCCKDAGCKW